jgi:small-conductance mechanosensitive channel
MRPAARDHQSVEALVQELDQLTRARQELRLDQAEPDDLEQNRLAIVAAQWDLSRALIRRYLPAVA